MKRSFWYGIGGLLLTVAQVQAQSLTGAWQGVETKTGETRYWPAMLRLQASRGETLFGVLYQEVGTEPAVSVTFQVKGARTGPRLQLEHVRKLDETGGSFLSYWCTGAIAFTYEASLEKLTGRATYTPEAGDDCDTGTFVFYRIKLKSEPTVKAGVVSALRVSGRDVRWFADAELTKPLATGNTYRAKLSKATTFYLTQGYYPSAESRATPIVVLVSGAAKTPPAPRQLPLLTPALKPDSAGLPAVVVAPPAAAVSAPVVLPTVLFRQGQAELLPESGPALDKLAADLLATPALRLRVAGHTDRLGEPGKNQVLSEQRAAAVKAYLARAGVAAGRLEAVGYGDTRPLYPSPDVRNRRVEVERLP